jgi:predicted RNA methylase
MPAETLAAAKLGNTRVTGKEQYYTPLSLAHTLVESVEQVLGPLKGKTVLEPAGGTGSFVEAALARGAKEVISFDIEPLHDVVAKGSFLVQNLDEENLITISNPPFGRNNSLSIPFFNHAATVSEAICFIVPRSWRKWSVTNRLDLNFELVFDQDLDIDYVDSTGELISDKSRLATCFQIWKRSASARVPVKIKDMGVIEKVSPELADVSLTIFGYGCGTVKQEFERVPNTTQLFLKLNHPKALEALNSVEFSRFYKSTAYTEALSIQEINFLLNEEIFGDPMIESGSK